MSRREALLKGVVVLVALVGVGVAAAGTGLVTGGDLPVIGSGDDASPGPKEATGTLTPTLNSTPVATPTPTHSATPTSTPTTTPTSTPETTATPAKHPLDQTSSDPALFERLLRDDFRDTLRSDAHTGVPLLATEYRTTDEGDRELWVVYWACDRHAYTQDQWSNIGYAVMHSVGNDYPSEPARIRLYGVVNLETYDDHNEYIKTSWAEKAANGSMDHGEYFKKWLRSDGEPTQNQTEVAYKMAIEDSTNATAEKAFEEKYEVPSNVSQRGCPAGVEGVPVSD